MPLILSIFYILISIFFLIYSYGFVDLNLTLSSNPAALSLISRLQHLVYFDRPLSARIFLVLISLLVILYLVSLYKLKKTKKFPWRFILALGLIFTLSYPLFSYDVFNYMFHSKIIWFYHKNPHIYAPLYFEGDPWLRFMRWVHTPAAYGPGHTLLYSLVYPLGLGKFTLILLITKLIPYAFYLWTIKLLGSIGQTLKSIKNPVLLQLGYALNPLILIEILSNVHNDGIMMAFYLYAVLLFLRGKTGKSILALLYGVSVKLMTIIFLPAYFLKRWLSTKQLLLGTAWLMYIPLIIWIGRFQPWYVVWFATASAVSASTPTLIFATLTTILTLYYYFPYVSTGFWNNSPTFIFSLVVAMPLLYLAYLGLRRLFVRQ